MKTALFHISREDTIQRVQDKFSQLFPSLEINFYTQNEKISQLNSCAMLSPECRISDLNPEFTDRSIQLAEDPITDEMENAIHNHFGLHVEIVS